MTIEKRIMKYYGFAVGVMFLIAMPITVLGLSVAMSLHPEETADFMQSIWFSAFVVYLYGGVPAGAVAIAHAALRKNRLITDGTIGSMLSGAGLGAVGSFLVFIASVFPLVWVVAAGTLTGLPFGFVSDKTGPKLTVN